MNLILVDDCYNDIPGLEKLWEATAVERWGYEKMRLTGDVLSIRREDDESAIHHEKVNGWRSGLHKQLGRTSSTAMDNKETFKIRWNDEDWYVQFWDYSVTLSKTATVRP